MTQLDHVRNVLSALLIAITLAMLVCGCAAVRATPINYANISNGYLVAYDIRTGDHFWERMLTPPHRLIVYRDEHGQLIVLDEQENADSLSALAAPLGEIGDHVVIPAIP